VDTGASFESVAEQVTITPPAERHPVDRNESALELARSLALDCRFEEAITVLDKAIAEARDVDATVTRQEAMAIWIAQLSPETRDLGRRRLGQLRERSPAGSHLAEQATLEQIWHAALAEHVGRLADDVVRRPAIPAGESIIWAAGLASVVMLGHCDGLPEARRAVLRLRDAVSRTGTTLAGLDLCLRAAVDYQLGDVGGAGDLALQVLSGMEGQRPPLLVRAFAAAMRVEALIEQGALDTADAVLADLDLLDTGGPDTIAHVPLLRARGRLRIEQSQAETGLDDLLRGRRIARDLGLASGSEVSWPSAIVALHRLGRTEEALRLGREELAEARSLGAPQPLAAAARTLGMVTPDFQASWSGHGH
jgi:hypothetical protein